MTKDEGQITSKDNSRLKHARAVRDGRNNGEIFIEGVRLCEEAAENLSISDYFFTPEFAETTRGGALLEKLKTSRGALVSSKLLESISDTKTPQGIVLLARAPQTGKEVLSAALSRTPLLAVLHELNNPANVGAILRTAEAAEVSGVILTECSANPFAPKSLRAAMGSAFRLPIWTNAKFAEVIEFCREREIKTICAALGADKSHIEIDWKKPRALIIGSEAHGLSREEIALADEALRIRMNPRVESLNAAVACGVILFEAARQRQI